MWESAGQSLGTKSSWSAAPLENWVSNDGGMEHNRLFARNEQNAMLFSAPADDFQPTTSIRRPPVDTLTVRTATRTAARVLMDIQGGVRVLLVLVHTCRAVVVIRSDGVLSVGTGRVFSRTTF